MQDPICWLDNIQLFQTLCLSFDRTILQRKRIFDTASIILSLMDLCVGDSKCYRSLMFQFSEKISPPAASSFCKARRKLPASAIGQIRDELLAAWDDEKAPSTWHGRVPYAVDGSKLNLPRELLKDGFKKPSKGFYPQGLLTAAYRVSDKKLYDIKFTSSWNEREQAIACLDNFSKNDLLIYDRGYISIPLYLEHMNRGIDAIFRINPIGSYKAVEEFWARGSSDEVVTIKPGDQALRKARKQLDGDVPREFQVRLIRYTIGCVDYLLATTIMDPNISVEDFRNLYSQRWKVEEFFKPYKQTIQIEKFHSKTLNGVEQEIEAAALLWNLMMYQAEMIPEDSKKTGVLFSSIPLPIELPTNSHISQQQFKRVIPRIYA